MTTPKSKLKDRPNRWSYCAAMALLPLAFASAQTSTSEEENVFELSPFEVDGSADTGYRATSTLAGSRLNTQLKDVAASVSVLTGEFLDDLGATDIEKALAYVAGVETALNTDFSERDQYGNLGDSGINTQPGNNRVRGLSRADVTQDFFQVGNGNLDRYNIERIAIVRGPNSILFGLGSPAGILNYTTKKASLGKDSTEVSVKVDSFGSLRSTFDLNRMISDKLAFRAMGLWENAKSQYSTSYDKDDRFSGSLLYRPIKNTTLRFGFELTENESRRPSYSLPVDNITGWIKNGRPTWDPTVNVGINPEEGFPDDERLQAGIEEYFPFQFTNIQYFDAEIGREPLLTSKGAVGFRNGEEVNQVVEATATTLARSRNEIDNVDNFVNPSASDPRIFPIFDVDLAALPGNRQFRKGQKYNLTLTQRITDDLHIELAAYRDHTSNENLSRFTGQDRQVSIDVNSKLLDGSDNPNFLRPFIAGRGGAGESDSESESYRATAAYEIDFAEKSDRFGFLGKHIFSGLLSDRRLTNFSASYNPTGPLNNDPETFGVNKGIYGHWIFQNYYVGKPFTPDMDYPEYGLFPTTYYGEGEPVTVYRPQNGATESDPLIWSNAPTVQSGRIYSRASWEESNVESEGLTWQSFLWGGRIAGTLGWRRDTIQSDNNSLSDNEIDPSDRHIWGPSDPEDLDDPVTGSTSTRGIVFHPFKWLSLHYNESDNFEVGVTKVYATLDDIPNTSGEGRDIGIVLRTPDSKIEAKINYFETSQKNVKGRGTLASTARFGVNTYERFAWATMRNFRNNRLRDGTFDNGGTYSWRGQELNEEQFLETFQYRWFDKDAPNNIGEPTEARYFAPSNSDDTVDVDAEGYELELTFNPTDNWRIAFNATKIATIQDNIGPGMAAYVKTRLPVWSLLWGDLVKDSEGNIIDASNGVRFQDRSVQKLMYTEYINRIVQVQNTNKLAEGRINVGQAEYSANMVTNYTFKQGRWKGFSVGGNARWREGSAIGYPIIETPEGPASDLANPFKSDSRLNVGLNATYRKKIRNGKVTWVTRVHLNDIIGDDKIQVSAINPDGSAAGFRAGREKSVSWTNTFRF